MTTGWDAGTWFLIGATVAVAIVWDLIVVFGNDHPGDSISSKLRRIGSRVAMVPYAWGVLGGHFWGPQHDPIFGELGGFLCVWAIGAVFGVVHVTLRKRLSIPTWFGLIYFGLGVPAGSLFWPL